MRKLLLLALILPVLSGCFPVVATGVGAGALIAGDRRTAGAYIDDEAIDLKASDLIGKRFKDEAHVNVTSYNRNVLLTGEAPNEAAKQEIERLVRGVANVRSITDELAIGPVSSFSTRSNDTLITTKVKGRFVDSNKVAANTVKVVTENGVVYLLGILKHHEADAAVEIARTTGDVKQVVKVFEYLD